MRTTIAAALLLSLTACDASSLQTAKTAAGIASSIASEAPTGCAILNAATGDKLGTACAPVAQDVSDVAKLVQDIIASLPKPSGAKAMAAPAMVAFKAKAQSGALVEVTLPADIAAQVQADPRMAR